MAKELVLMKLLPFQHLLAKTVEEIRVVRTQNKEIETKLRKAIEDKYAVEVSMEALKTLHQEAKAKLQAEYIEMKDAYEMKLIDWSDERVANKLIIESLSNETKLLKNEINQLILNKLTAENKVDALENKLQSQDILKESVLSEAQSIKKLIEETEIKYHEASEAQLKLQSSVQKAHSICLTIQSEYQAGKEVVINLEETNRQLRCELIALRSQLITKTTSVMGKENEKVDLPTWSLSRDLERQTKLTEHFRSQVDDLKDEIKVLTSSLSDAHILLNESTARERSLNEIAGLFRDDPTSIHSQVKLDKVENGVDCADEVILLECSTSDNGQTVTSSHLPTDSIDQCHQGQGDSCRPMII